MTLQDKKKHLLDDEKNNDSDAIDLFDKYGGSTDMSASNPISITTQQTQGATRPSLDEGDEANEIKEQPVIQSTEYSEQAEKKWEKEYFKKEDSTQNMAVSGTKIQESKPTTDDTHQNSIHETKTPYNNKDKTVIGNSDRQESPHTVAPVKQNYNSVLQGRSKMQKNSLKPKKDKPSKKEIHIDPSKKTILIVDDDIDTLDMYADVFESADYNVLRASDGLEAMNIVAEHTPHIIFTGIVMPRMDGFSMMEALKQNSRTADIPVVINSHLGRDTDKEKAEELGAHDFIIRGFTQPREVVERIGALLLKSEYIFHFNKNDKEARKLAKDLGVPNFYHCPQGQEMVLKLSIADEKDLKFFARFSCVDSKKDKK